MFWLNWSFVIGTQRCTFLFAVIFNLRNNPFINILTLPARNKDFCNYFQNKTIKHLDKKISLSRTKNICCSAYGGGRPDDVALLLSAAPHVPQHALLLPPPALQVSYTHVMISSQV